MGTAENRRDPPQLIFKELDLSAATDYLTYGPSFWSSRFSLVVPGVRPRAG
jgi:hypothetical protein